MEPEIELELFAALCADVEAGRPLAEVLRAEGLLESTWAHSRDAWMGRMSNGPDSERKRLEERYLAAFHARKRLTSSQVAPSTRATSTHEIDHSDSGELDDPPTRRAPMGTVVMDGAGDPNAPPAPIKEFVAKESLPPPSATPPMGVNPMKLVETHSARRPPNPELTPPMGVPAPNLAEPASTRPMPRPEITPPMGVPAPNLAEPASTRPMPRPEITPPMGVPAPKLSEVGAPRSAKHAEVTPPMGVSAPTLADIPPPKPLPPPTERTPPMGVPAPNLGEVASTRPRRALEPTPPMRPRSDFIPDDLARVAADAVADRKTDPPPPVPSRPALPFPGSAQAASIPTASNGPPSTRAPAASTTYRAPSAQYPAPPPVPPQAPPVAPPVAPPMAFPQQAPQPAVAPGPTYGSYPSMMALAAQGAAGPVPSATQSSAGFPASTKAAGPPLALGNFPSSPSGPRMSLDVYAAFAAEIAVKPVEVAEIRERYGLTDVAHTAEDEAWQRRFSSDRDSYVRYAKLFQHYRDWFSGRTPR